MVVPPDPVATWTVVTDEGTTTVQADSCTSADGQVVFWVGTVAVARFERAAVRSWARA